MAKNPNVNHTLVKELKLWLKSGKLNSMLCKKITSIHNLILWMYQYFEIDFIPLGCNYDPTNNDKKCGEELPDEQIC